MRRCLAAMCAVVILVSCGGIDKILEGNPLIIKLTFAADSGPLTIPQGSSKSLRVRVTPVGDVLHGGISISTEKIPPGIAVVVDSFEVSGITTSARIAIDVGSTTELGPQEVRLLAKALHSNDGGFLVRVLVVPPAALDLTLAKTTLTIARGGGGPVTAQLARTSLPLAVKLSLDGAPSGITATFDTLGTTANSTTASIVVASTVALGSYNMNVRAKATGVGDQLTPLTVTVTNDAIQLISDVGISTAQAANSSTAFYINRGAGVGPVTLTAENLPIGVTASFDKPNTTDPSDAITLFASGTVTPGDYTATIRAQAAGFPDATTTVGLTVLDASIGVAVTPVAFEVLQGQNSLVNVTYTRTRFTGNIGLSVSGLPTGVTPTVTPANTPGSVATILFSATASAPAGAYDVTVNATPTGLGAAKVQSTVVKLTVRAVPTGANVVLDWTGCSLPVWVAAQNGASTSAWSSLALAGSQAGFLVNQGRGGYAWYDGSSLNVRYALQSELTAKPILMCPPAGSTGSKTITGIGVHTVATELTNYTLGLGSATSTGTVPQFTMFGVLDGPQDLVAMSNNSFIGTRGLIRRDINLPNGGALDPVDLTSPEGFTPVSRTMTVSIALLAGEGFNYLYNYLTTQSWVENRIAAGTASTVTFLGMPDNVQRPDDYHEFFINGQSTTQGTRTMTVTFHTAANRTMVVPAYPTVPASGPVTLLQNTPMTRLTTTITSIPSNYNGSLTLSYRFNSQSMSVAATTGYTGLTNATLAMPDFTGISGFQQSFAIASGASGLWRLSLDGASIAGPRCTENRSTFGFVRTGTF